MTIKLPTKDQLQTRQDAYAFIEKVEEIRKQNRSRERAVKARLNSMTGYPILSKENLLPNLVKTLPPHLMPKNIGDFNEVMWDFTFTVTLDFGTDPVFDPQKNYQSAKFQVPQEAAFLICGFSRAYKDTGLAGRGAPIILNFRDAQSTRQFNNDTPFPIQNIGENGRPTLLETPLLVARNSVFLVEPTCSWLPEPVSAVGNGLQEITFFGLRVRDEDGAKTLSTLFL